MKGLPTFPRVVWPVAASLVAGILLGLPSSTRETPMPSAPTAQPERVRPSDAPAATATAPARRVQEPGPASASSGPIDAGAGSDRGGPPHAAERPAVGGMVIGIAPETGELGVPTREQWNELSDLERQRLEHSSAGLVEVHHPDGSVSVDLQGRFQEYETVRVGPDGKLIYQCVDGEENARRAVAAPAPSAPEER